MKERIKYLDSVKCVAMYLVILGHVIQFLCVELGHNNWLKIIICSFHMPLFMLLSGYFSASSFKKTFAEFIKRKSQQLLIPITTWTIIISSFLFIVYHSKEAVIIELIGGSWFLRTLFACYFYVYFIKKIKAPDWLLSIVSILIMFIFPKASFLAFNWMLLFFWSGYYLNKYRFFIDKYRAIITILSFVIYCVIFYNIQDCGYALININTLKTRNLIILLKFLGSLSASIFVINIIFYLSQHNNSLTEIMCKIGKYTLGIYLIQSFLVARLFPLIPKYTINNIYIYNFVYAPLVAIFILLLCVILIKYLSKNKYMNLLLFGNQY